MLTIVCGEDTVKAREYYRFLIDSERKKNNEVSFVAAGEISEAVNPDTAPVTLFGEKQVYVTSDLNKFLGRSAKSSLLTHLKKIADSTTIQLISFENGVSARELKIRNTGTVKEFKPNENIFKLLDSLYPQNIAHFLGLLEGLSGTADGFILIMLIRHVRKLVLIKEGTTPRGLASWQAAKLKSQASRWGRQELLSFYDALLRIDMQSRTGRSPFNVRSGLQIAACYFM